VLLDLACAVQFSFRCSSLIAAGSENPQSWVSVHGHGLSPSLDVNPVRTCAATWFFPLVFSSGCPRHEFI
jgi:hypothetical protein